MNFWGEDSRRQIAKNFYVTPLTHTCVFNNQKIISACSKKELKINAKYYIIKLTDKKNDALKSIHFLAKDTAEELLEFAYKSKLLLFNPITDEYEENEPKDVSSSSNNNQVRVCSVNNFSKLNREVPYN